MSIWDNFKIIKYKSMKEDKIKEILLNCYKTKKIIYRINKTKVPFYQDQKLIWKKINKLIVKKD